MIAAAALFLLRPAQLPEQSVTFESLGAPLPRLVAELSKSTSTPLSCAPVFKSDVLVVRVKDAPLRELMARIADSALGEWKQQGGVWMLERSVEKERSEARSSLEQETAFYAKTIQDEAKAVAALGPWDEAAARRLAASIQEAGRSSGDTGRFDASAYRKIQVLEQGGPAGRAMSRFVALLDPAMLAALPDGVRVVFSTQPTPTQRRLPPDLMPALRDVVAEQNVWAGTSSGDEVGYGSSAMQQRLRFEGGIAKALVAMTRRRGIESRGVRIEMMVANQKGRFLVRSDRSLNRARQLNAENLPRSEPGEQPLKLSETAVAWAKSGAGLRSGRPPTPLPKNVIELLLQPEKVDPLSMGGGELLVRYAEAKQSNLVANLPDLALFAPVFAGGEALTPSVARKAFEFLGLSEQRDGDWLTLRPESLAYQRAQRADRDVLGTFVRSVVKEGRVSLNALAAYAAKTQGDDSNSLGPILSIFLIDTDEPPNSDWHTLRLYGSLSAGQHRAIRDGQPIPLRSLSPEQMKLVNHMVYGSFPSLQLQQRDEAARPDFEAFYNGLLREPTEVLPGGLPAESRLVVRTESADVAFAEGYQLQDSRRSGQPMSAADIAQRLLAKERPGLMPWVEDEPAMDSRMFRFGRRTTFNFEFEFTPELSLLKQLRDLDSDGKKQVRYADLPKGFMDEVAKQLVQMREAYKNAKPGEYGPPPRPSVPPPNANAAR